MGNTPALRGLLRTSLVSITLVAGLVGNAVPAGATSSAADVDSLWNQPQGISVDSGWYFMQTWWDQAGLKLERDQTRRGRTELAQANADLLNAYSLLSAARMDPGPQPVPVIDPLLSSLYATISGVHVTAPLGSLFGAINQIMLNLEGRGSTAEITASLLLDFSSRQDAAYRDLAQSPDFDAVWPANSARQAAILAKLQALTQEETSLTQAVTGADHERQDLLTKPRENESVTGDQGQHGQPGTKP